MTKYMLVKNQYLIQDTNSAYIANAGIAKI